MEKKIYTVDEVGEILCMNRSKTYEFVKKVHESRNPEFRVLKIGEQYRIPVQSFEKWLNEG